jgi:hypothetical protein
MQAEYDFDALGPPVVGKYYEAALRWKKRQVVLDPDLLSDFPDSESVNRTLRRVAQARRRRRERAPAS